MDNLPYFYTRGYETDMFGSNQEEERKVHTPYVAAQDYSSQNCSNIKPINQNIQLPLSDLVIVKKAKSRKTKTIEDSNSNKKFGHWSSEENKRYHWFLELHHEHFFNKHLRRTDRIFKSMATFVQTRQAEQCRSHHQKMQKRHKQFSKILMSLRLQNYNTDDHKLILTQMTERGYINEDISILSTIQLRQKHQNSQNQQNFDQNYSHRSPRIKLSKSENTATSLPSSISHLQVLAQQNKQQQGQQINELFDIFNDTYEKNMDLNELFLIR